MQVILKNKIFLSESLFCLYFLSLALIFTIIIMYCVVTEILFSKQLNFFLFKNRSKIKPAILSNNGLKQIFNLKI